MPVYEYKCKTCNKIMEFTQNILDEPLVYCPNCHAKTLIKLISKNTFHLKGSGWYFTDYKGK